MGVGKAVYEINWREVFGVIPADDALRSKIEQRAIDMIRERTQEGTDKHGKPFAEYSPEYKASLAFKAGGKSSAVDMTLSGDMLNLLDVVRASRDKTTFGWDDETQNAKAYNHTRGVTVPRRDFLGLTREQIRDLKEEFREEVELNRDESRAGAETLNDEDRDALRLIDLIRGRFEE